MKYIKRTASNKYELLFDKDDYEKIKDLSIYFNESNNMFYCNIGNGKKRCLKTFFYPEAPTLKSHVWFKNSNKLDYRRKNVRIISRTEYWRMLPPKNGRKYKGLHYNKYGELEGVGFCFDTSKTFFIPLTFFINEEKAAGMYNSILDYLKITGYKNDVPHYPLTKLQKENLEKYLAKHIYK